ncbi:ferritin-like domain-containing protein [Clostridium botulinum]|uniref:Ferritin-like domain-containing protein n=2 Tax=Clostridium botulinum TaxID=1491 RepID=A0ABD7CUE3_CLOBO|nr:ferritin-like domain-containing protein [Clostridium botulinum]
MDFTKYDFNKALELVKDAVQGEREDELLYDYLISKAPSNEEKEIIRSIRDDERKHRKMFKFIYKFYTGKDIEASDEAEDFEKPRSYIDGIKKALFGELAAMEKYREIRKGLPSRYYRDMVFGILTDEIKHAIKYNYILNTTHKKNGKIIEIEKDEDMNKHEMRTIMW